MKFIKLTQGKFVLVDDEDFEWLNQYKWYCQKALSNRFYARGQAGKNKKTIFMHRFILNINDKRRIDHMNGDSLDNRKSNLRICTQQQNLFNKKMYKNNKSGYKGVWFTKNRI